MDSIERKVAIVTGGAQGIGKACAYELAATGVSVAVFDTDSSNAEKTVSEIRNETHNANVKSFHVDVSDILSVQNGFAKVEEMLGTPCILINNAGIYTSSPLLDVSTDEWNRTIAVNLNGVFFCSQVISKYFMKTKWGRIVNIASVGGKVGWPRNHAYCASKAGVIGLTRVLALDLAPYNVTVNSICPGNTNTNMMIEVDENISTTEGLEKGQFIKEQIERIPLKRFAEGKDIANLALFLITDSARHITGQALNVDGGTVMY